MKQLSFTEMIGAIKLFEYPRAAAFVTIWWWDLGEAARLIRLLRTLDYYVTSYKFGNEIEIMFSSIDGTQSLYQHL
jgi:hypothetical protein